MSNTASGAIDHHFDPSTSTGIPNKKLMMWLFLASDCMFFGCLISTHLIYRLHPPPGVPVAKSVFSIELTSFTLTGTHGTHVAVGVLWLILMYVRSCQPRDAAGKGGWFLRNIAHVVIF